MLEIIPKNPALTVSVLIGLFPAIYVGKIIWVRYKYRHIPGPPTKGILGFLLGHLAEFLPRVDKGELFNDIMLEW